MTCDVELQYANVGSDVIQPSAAVRDLCIYLDSQLSMKQHVNAIATCDVCVKYIALSDMN